MLGQLVLQHYTVMVVKYIINLNYNTWVWPVHLVLTGGKCSKLTNYTFIVPKTYKSTRFIIPDTLEITMKARANTKNIIKKIYIYFNPHKFYGISGSVIDTR